MRRFSFQAGEVRSLRFAADGRSLYALAKESGGLHLFRRVCRIATLSGGVLNEWSLSGSEVAIFTPDLRSVYHSVSVAVAGGELDLRCLDLSSGRDRVAYESHVPYPSCVSFTPNGHILAIGGQHYSGDGFDYVHRLDVWHCTELEPVRTDVRALAYSPNGRFLAVGGFKTIQVWDGRTPTAQWAGRADVIAWATEGRFAWIEPQSLTIASSTSAEAPATMNPQHGGFSALAFSACGRFLATGTDCGIASVHDAVTGDVRATFDWGIGKIHSVAFAPDGLTCAAGGDNGQVVVWDVE